MRERQWREEGVLGLVVDRLSNEFQGQAPPGGGDAKLPRVVQQLDAAMFYEALPPPNVRDTRAMGSAATLQRSMLRDVDLSALLTGPRLIVLGYLEGSALPTPLRLDGEPIRSDGQGLTVVRMIFDL